MYLRIPAAAGTFAKRRQPKCRCNSRRDLAGEG
jgi:hypothetical protein